MLAMRALAGQSSAHFQVSLRIVPRPPAPKLSQQVVFPGLPGDPPHPMLKDRVTTQGKAGDKLIVITTEF